MMGLCKVHRILPRVLVCCGIVLEIQPFKISILYHVFGLAIKMSTFEVSYLRVSIILVSFAFNFSVF